MAAEPGFTPVETANRAARDIRVVVGRLRRRLRNVADIAELTPSQTSVMSRLSKDGPASTSELAAAERVRPQSMSATVGVLEEREFVIRKPDRSDGRKLLVSLTDAGRDFIEGGRQARQEWLAQALADQFTEPERNTIIEAMALLDRLNR